TLREQRRSLGRGDLDVVRDAGRVALSCVVGRALSGSGRGLARGQLVGEMVQSCEVVLQFAIGGQRDAAVVCGGLVEGSPRLPIQGAATPGIQQRNGGRRAQ